jgi:hypothetical protein
MERGYGLCSCDVFALFGHQAVSTDRGSLMHLYLATYLTRGRCRSVLYDRGRDDYSWVASLSHQFAEKSTDKSWHIKPSCRELSHEVDFPQIGDHLVHKGLPSATSWRGRRGGAGSDVDINPGGGEERFREDYGVSAIQLEALIADGRDDEPLLTSHHPLKPGCVFPISQDFPM